MRTGYRMGNATVYDAMYRDGLLDPLCGLLMGETAENLVDRYDISREEQDEFALESQQKAAAGAAARAAEIVRSRSTPAGKGSVIVSEDEHPRPDTHAWRRSPSSRPSSARAAPSRPATRAGITDGAAAMVLMSRIAGARRGPRAARADRRR